MVKWHDREPCNLNVITVEKTNGWLFFCDNKEYYKLLQEELRGKESSDDGTEIPAKLFDYIKKRPRIFYAHVGMASTYKKWIFTSSGSSRASSAAHNQTTIQLDHNGCPEFSMDDPSFPELTLAGVPDQTLSGSGYYERYSPEDWLKGKPSQCICADHLDFDELYNFLKKAQAAGEERKRAEEENRRTQEEAERLERERQRRDMGRRGEQEVDYVIEWLAAKGFHSVPKKHCVKYDDETILLWNPEHIDEPQEYDHIVIGRKGVFLIETKNYRGKLIINPGGNWIREVDGTEEGMISPVQQIGQHKQLLQSILPEGIPIFPVICIAHPKAIIEGAKNCTVPLKKSDVLGDYIESKDYIGYKEKPLCDAQVQECLDRIEHYRLG